MRSLVSSLIMISTCRSNLSILEISSAYGERITCVPVGLLTCPVVTLGVVLLVMPLHKLPVALLVTLPVMPLHKLPVALLVPLPVMPLHKLPVALLVTLPVMPLHKLPVMLLAG